MGLQQSSRSCLQSDLSTVCFKCIWITIYYENISIHPFAIHLEYLILSSALLILIKKRFWVNFETHCRSLMDRWCRECRSAELKGFYLKKIKSKKMEIKCFLVSSHHLYRYEWASALIKAYIDQHYFKAIWVNLKCERFWKWR